MRDAAFVFVAPVPALSPHQAVPKIITLADGAERENQAEAHGDGQHRQKAGEQETVGRFDLPRPEWRWRRYCCHIVSRPNWYRATERFSVTQGLFTLISGSRRPLPACQSRRATQRVPLHTPGAQRRVARRQGPSLRVARPGGRLRRCPHLQGAHLAARGRLASSPQAGQRDPRN